MQIGGEMSCATHCVIYNTCSLSVVRISTLSMHDDTEMAINWALVPELRDSPGAELKYDTFNRLLMVTFGSTVDN